MDTPFLGMLDLGSWGVVPVPCKTDKKQSALAFWSVLHKEANCVGAITLVKLLIRKTKRKEAPVMIAEKGVIVFSFSLQWEGKQLFSAVCCARRAGIITQSFLTSSNLA